jgi:HK97 family phage portal protein
MRLDFWNNPAVSDKSTPLRAAITAEREGRGAADAIQASSDDSYERLAAILGIGLGGTVGGVTVNERNALGFASVWACVLAISQDLAALPCQLYQNLPTGGKLQVSGHPASRVLNLQASPLQNAMPFRMVMHATVLLHGNAYALIKYGPKYTIKAVFYKHPSQTEVLESEGRLYYRFAGDATIYQDYEVLHLRGLCLDQNGIMGLSVLSLHRENIGTGLAAQRTSARFYDNGAKVSGTLETDQLLKPETVLKLKEQFASQYGGADNAGKVVTLEQGLKFKSIGLPPADAQFLDTRKFTAREVASMFRVPAHKMGDLERSTNNNIEQQGIDYVQNCLTPWAVSTEQEYQLKLLRTTEVDTHYFKHNFNGLLRGDATARGNFYRVMTDIGAYSINEVRALEDANGIGLPGDVRFVQVNRQTLENAMLAKPDPTTKPAAGTPPNE